MAGWRAAWIWVLMLGAGPAVAESAANSVGRGICAVPATVCIVTVHKGQILRPQRPAKIVLVADPEIADVVIESPKLVFILGRQPGETSLFVLDEKGDEIHNIDIVVRPNAKGPVTVHRDTEETTLNCAPRCVTIETTAGAAGAGPATPAPGATQGGDLSGAQPAAN